MVLRTVFTPVFVRIPRIIYSLLVGCILCSNLLFATVVPPKLSSAEVVAKSEEIFKAHVKYKNFNQEIAKRSMLLFIDELDPLKTYFINGEIEQYLNPSDELLNAVVQDYKKQRLTVFEEIYGVMLVAIERRNSIEEKIKGVERSDAKTSAKEIHESPWAENREELEVKLLKIRDLQRAVAEKLESSEKYELFFNRITKARIVREKEIIGKSKLEQKHQVYSFFLKGLSSSLDSHTVYFTPSEARKFLLMQIQQRLFGIGAQLRDDLNGLTVIHIMNGSPAHKSGDLKVGDKIIAVDHEPIVSMGIEEAVELIRGPKGSAVILTILREQSMGVSKFDISIVRDEVVLSESRYGTHIEPFGDGVIGCLQLHSFYQDPTSSSSDDMRTEINKMKRDHKLLGIVLDLRHNSGGLLPQAVQVTGLFIKKGVVAVIKDCDDNKQKLRNLSGSPAWDGPLIVLTNRGSASAAEIVALSLSDYGRCIVIGEESTFGKGSYQTFTLESTNVEKVNPRGEYKVTRGKYYTTSGNTPQLVGVKSDIEVPGILSWLEIGEKYTRYPLENDQIDSQFVDDLSDIHPIYRPRMRKILETDLQVQRTKNSDVLSQLATHSKERIGNNPNYQKFISELKKTNKYEFNASIAGSGQNDLQLEETLNIMKEYIMMSQ